MNKETFRNFCTLNKLSASQFIVAHNLHTIMQKNIVLMCKLYIMCAILISTFSCKQNGISETEQVASYPFYVGTYTNKESHGIYKYLLKSDGTVEAIGLAAVAENPSFLCKSQDGKYIVAINSIKNADGAGTVESFLIDNDSLIFLSRSSSGGANPCFVSINEDGFVLMANYGSGNIGLVHLNENGALSELLDVQQHHGQGTTDRQEGPHAHSVWFASPDNQIISVDLGTNELWFSELDVGAQKFVPYEQAKLSMAPGAGPRHLTFHPNKKWFYIVNELDCTVTLVRRLDNGIYELGTSISTLPEDYKEPNFCADIHISSDGNFVYASNRGHNSIVIYEVNQLDGSLKLIGHESTRGEWPRNFSLSPDDNYLMVANQHTNNIVSFKRNQINGALQYIDNIEAPTPVCLLFL